MPYRQGSKSVSMQPTSAFMQFLAAPANHAAGVPAGSILNAVEETALGSPGIGVSIRLPANRLGAPPDNLMIGRIHIFQYPQIQVESYRLTNSRKCPMAIVSPVLPYRATLSAQPAQSGQNTTQGCSALAG